MAQAGQIEPLDLPADYPYEEENGVLAAREEGLIEQLNANQNDPSPVTPEWIAEARLYCMGLKQQIMELENRRLQPHTWRLIDELAVLRAQWMVLLWRIFPINDLPPEVLSQIFQHAVMAPSSSQVCRIRLNLASICRYWRDLVLNTPSLWSVIEFKGRAPFHAAYAAIERARSAVLTILIDVRDRRWNNQEEGEEVSVFVPEMTELMQSILPLFAQTSEFYILCDTWLCMHAALTALVPVYAPLLHRFEVLRSGRAYVTFEQGNVPNLLTQPVSIFQGGAPRLHHISFDGVHVHWAEVPLRALRVFEMRKMAVEVMPRLPVFRSILVSSNSLESLVLESAGPQWVQDELAGFVPIGFPNLINLTLGDFATDYGVFLLSLFTAPNLRRFYLGQMEEENCTNLFKKMTNMFPNTTVLSLTNVDLDDDIIVRRWIKSMPKIRYVKLSFIGPAFFTLMLRMVSCEPKDPAEEDDIMDLDQDDEDDDDDYDSIDPEYLIPIIPELETLECGAGVEGVDTLRLLEGREALGAKVRRLLVPLSALQLMSGDEVTALKDAAHLNIVPAGSRPELDKAYLTDTSHIPWDF